MSVAERLIWGICRIITETMEGVGFAGLLFFLGVGLMKGIKRLWKTV